jgi:hyperosmotically inducible protein
MCRFGRRLTLLAILLVVVVALPSAQAQATPSQKSAKTEEKLPPSLSREIRHQLLVVPYYSVFDFLSFKLYGNKVTLTGQVLRPTLKAHAEAAVKSIEGVDAVINQVEVLPPSPADDELRRAVYRAIYEDSTLARYAVQPIPAIHLIVKNGNLSLEGVVSNPADKNLAEVRTKGVANILGVTNNLVVQAKGSAAE